jgi:hypothetical protein
MAAFFTPDDKGQSPTTLIAKLKKEYKKGVQQQKINTK